eukprot:EG_transcript_9306
MQAPPRLPPTAQLRNVSNTALPAKKGKSSLPSAPRTPPKTQHGFITSSPASARRISPVSTHGDSAEHKQKSKVRPPRTPSFTLFSPTYPPMVGVSEFHEHQPATPTSPCSELSPVQKSLQENVARYGHLEQQFDEYDCEDFDPYRFIASVLDLSPHPSKHCLPPKRLEMPSLTLVLDLDETLVHCSTDAAEIPNPDFVFHVDFQSNVYTVNCRTRPGLEEFLEYIKNRFEVVIFTASQKVYANKLLDILDPTQEIFHHRVFREGCTNVEGNYLKDLSALGRDLGRTVIVDNSPQAFAYQLDNGIPILSWFESPHDRELFKVIPLLDRLLEAEDVRPALRQRFQLYRRVEAYTELLFADCESLESFEKRLADCAEAVV